MKISIIIPVYTVQEQYLRECLDSIAAQDMQEMECLLISDGAPDKEESICREYCAKDSRFRFIHKEHAGVSAARNLGIKEAQGEYVTFVDSDDWIERNTCSSYFKIAQEKNTDILVTSFFIESHEHEERCYFLYKHSGNIPKEKSLSASIHPTKASHSCFTAVYAKLYKRNLLTNINFDESLSIGEDRFFAFCCYQKAKNIFFLKEAFYHYRYNEKSAFRSFRSDFINDFFLYIEKFQTYNNNAFKKEISKEAYVALYYCWNQLSNYSLPHNQKNLFVKKIVLFMKSKRFKKLIPSQLVLTIIHLKITAFRIRKNLYFTS